jgi:DNA-binding CsgD family transcriptional regulator
MSFHSRRGMAWKTRIVGRDDEIADLESQWQRAVAGEFRCVLLQGDPGVGKTRLAVEMLQTRRTATIALSARAHPLSATASFGLWAEALEPYLRGLPGAELSQLCDGHLDDLAGLLRSVAAVNGSGPLQQPTRSRLLGSLAVLLSNLAAKAPVLIVLDDVHLADPSSIDALQLLAGSLSRSRVLVISSARPGELAEQMLATQVLLNLEQEGVLHRITVGPLRADGIHELVKLILRSVPPRPVVDWLVKRSRGNPLFALSLLQELLDEGADLSNPKLLMLPGSLADRISNRVSGLDDAQQTLLEVLAVTGSRVDFGDLARLTDRPRELLGPSLQRLTRSRLVVEEERGRRLTYEIAHPLIQELIYEDIGGAQRNVLHRQVGRVLLAMGRLGEAAPHFARSAELGDSEAIDVLGDALRQAEERSAYREGLKILGVLVEVIPVADRRWIGVADALSRRAEWVVDHRADGDALAGIRALREMDELLTDSEDLGLRAAVKARLTSFFSWGTGDLELAETSCREALALFEQQGDQGNALLAALELAYIAGNRGDLAAFHADAGQVLANAEARGERYAILQAVGVRGIGAFYLGHFAEAESAIRRSIGIAHEDQRIYRLNWSLMSLGWVLGYAGRLEEALRAFDEAKSANPLWRESNVLELQASVHWLAGDFSASLAAVQEVLAWNPRALGLRRGIGAIFAALSAAEMGLLAEARDHLAMAWANYEREWLFLRPCCLHAGAVLAWREGRPREALPALRESVDSLLRMNARPFAAVRLLDVAELASELHEAEVAAETAVRLRDVAEYIDLDLYRGLADVASACAHLAAGRPERAAEPARHAASLLAGLGYPVLHGRALYVLGQALVHKDRDAAVSALKDAGTVFDACQAPWRRDRTLDALRELGGRGRRAAGAVLGPAALTAREREVARLAVQRLTAHEIATQLFISERTVNGHLANIYAKTGARSKVDFARRARELDL